MHGVVEPPNKIRLMEDCSATCKTSICKFTANFIYFAFAGDCGLACTSKFNLVQEVVLNFIYIIILISLPFFSPREYVGGGGGKDVSCSKTVWSLRKILYHLGRVQNSSAA